MKNYKNRLTLQLSVLLLATSFHSVMMAMIPSSSRRMLAPAMRSGFRYMGSQAGVVGGSNAVNSNFSGHANNVPAFSLMPMQYAGPSFKAYRSPLQSVAAGSQSGQDTNFGSRLGLWAGLFGGGALAASMTNTAHADNQEQSVDISGLLDLDRNLDSVDVILYPDLAQFIKKYSCSFDLGKRSEFVQATQNYFQGLDEQKITPYQNSAMYQQAGFFNRNGAGRHNFSAVSGNLVPVAHETQFFIKGSEIDRVINAERLKVYLKKKGFHNFKVAPECLHYTGQSVEILSPAIKLGNQDKKISLDEIQKIWQIAVDTGYWDWQFGRNWMRDHQDNLVCVDTEDISFLFAKEIADDRAKEIMSRSKINRLGSLFMFYKGSMDQAAYNWLDKKIDEYDGLREIINSGSKKYEKQPDWMKATVNQNGVFTDIVQQFQTFNFGDLMDEQEERIKKLEELSVQVGLIQHLLPEDSRYDRVINFTTVKEQFERYLEEQRLAQEQKKSQVQVVASEQSSLEEID